MKLFITLSVFQLFILGAIVYKEQVNKRYAQEWRDKKFENAKKEISGV